MLLEKQFVQNSIFYVSATSVCSREEGSFDKDFIVDSGSLLEGVNASGVQAVFRLTPYFAVHEDKSISVFLFAGNVIRKEHFDEADCIITYLDGVKVAGITFVPGRLSLTHRVRETNQDGNFTNEALRPDKQFVCELLEQLCMNVEGLQKSDEQEEGFYNITEALRKQFEGLRDAYDNLLLNL